jgi:iron complex outermembrane recepter protein
MVFAHPQRNPLATAVFAALVTMSLAPVAMAQESALPQGGTPETEEPTTLSAIKVTAQKREEAMQDVPVSVTALSEQVLKDTGVRDVKDLQALVPGLTVTSTQSEAQTTARIRGIGTVGDNAGLESSVGVVIDGVYRQEHLRGRDQRHHPSAQLHPGAGRRADRGQLRRARRVGLLQRRTR